MFSHLSEKLVNKYIDHQIIKPDDKQLYLYGINITLTVILNILTTVVIGLIFRCVLGICLFMGLYIPLRSFSGGYHAKTPLRCYYYSIIMLCLVAIYIKHYSLYLPLCYCIMVLSSFLVFLLTPVEDKNKKLDDLERRRYKHISQIILILYDILFIVFAAMNVWIYNIIMCVIIIMNVMLVLGYIKNKTNNHL